MTPADRTAARAALDEGRTAYQRLDQIRGPEDTAADLVDLWRAAEQAMRAMLGGSVLTGQTLVRELRQRGIIALEQANALASFWDARSRVDDVGYRPTLTDVGYARVAYNELARAVDAPVPPASGAAARAPAPPTPEATPVMPPAPSGAERRATIGRPGTRVLVPALLALAIVLALAAYFTLRTPAYDRDMAAAVALLQSGSTEAARGAFAKIASEYPDRAEPHIFLARIARTGGDVTTARDELARAIRLDPNNARAQREMGLFLLAQNDPALARNFLTRAVRLAPNDSAAQGYLGCALVQLGMVDLAQRFLSRAGPGSWSACATPPGSPPPAPAPAPR